MKSPDQFAQERLDNKIHELTLGANDDSDKALKSLFNSTLDFLSGNEAEICRIKSTYLKPDTQIDISYYIKIFEHKDFDRLTNLGEDEKKVLGTFLNNLKRFIVQDPITHEDLTDQNKRARLDCTEHTLSDIDLDKYKNNDFPLRE